MSKNTRIDIIFIKNNISLIKENLLFIVVAFFLLAGNLPRVIPVKSVFGNINIGEITVYVLALILYPIRITEIMRKDIGFILIFGTVFSVVVGLVKWGIDISALFYACRLLFQLALAHLLGYLIAYRYGRNVRLILNKYIFLYLFIGVAAIVLLLIFPESEALWIVLSSVGIEFNGDPHIGRLVSLYFDPNFYATIVVLPILYSFQIYLGTKKKRYLIYFAFLAITLFLSVSRSGISLFFIIVMFYFLLSIIKSIVSFTASKSILRIIPIVAFVFVIIIAISYNQTERVAVRFMEGVVDESSMARYDSFLLGQSLFEKEVLLGYGYNFTLSFIQDLGRLGIDSSLQMLLLSYGLIPVLTIASLMFYKIWIIDIRLNFKDHLDGDMFVEDVFDKWRLFLVYFILTLVWAANFNQVLFYPFWIIPVFSFLFYFEIISDKRYFPVTKFNSIQ